jgi:hypothetical protein
MEQMSWKTAIVKTKKETKRKSLAIIEIGRDVKWIELAQIKSNGTLLYNQGSNSTTRKLIG